MLVRLILFAALVAACIPAARGEDVVPNLPADMPIPLEGTSLCYPGANVCIITFADYQKSLAGEQQAVALIRALITKVQAAHAELAKLKESCAAKLQVVPDGTRKKS